MTLLGTKETSMKSRPLVLSGVLLVMAVATGVRITAEPAGAIPTFNKDVAPIIFNNCVTCHRPNQMPRCP